ncbi:hypothetical protein Ahy_A06g027891 [Arachis hypogaea]|uniref:Aminotransferase-like plant mobile domain-containing protein n=1 Tax=Arachis hypogaea TaxID=3818 RepID=A0A445CQ23_ARAHY|nr:hypothetical protein Ahy_A06g027891 [Arachis hypogaea]
MEHWRSKTYTFHLSCGECTITLPDVAYHLGLRTHGEPVGGCLHDFQTWYQQLTWEYVDELLVSKPPHESRHMPLSTTDPATFRQYTRCYIMQLIGGYLMTNKSNNQVHIRWLLLLADFRRCNGLSWGSIVLAWTYQSLCHAAHCEPTYIAECISLLVSWIYHRIP